MKKLFDKRTIAELTYDETCLRYARRAAIAVAVVVFPLFALQELTVGLGLTVLALAAVGFVFRPDSSLFRKFVARSERTGDTHISFQRLTKVVLLWGALPVFVIGQFTFYSGVTADLLQKPFEPPPSDPRPGVGRFEIVPLDVDYYWALRDDENLEAVAGQHFDLDKILADLDGRSLLTQPSVRLQIENGSVVNLEIKPRSDSETLNTQIENIINQFFRFSNWANLTIEYEINIDDERIRVTRVDSSQFGDMINPLRLNEIRGNRTDIDFRYSDVPERLVASRGFAIDWAE